MNFHVNDWRQLDVGGLETFDLPPAAVAEAIALKSQYPRLSANDCFCLSSTLCFENAILITGDRLLRSVGAQLHLCVYGVLWLTDQLQAMGACSKELLITALEYWRNDPTVFLPLDEINIRLHSLE